MMSSSTATDSSSIRSTAPPLPSPPNLTQSIQPAAWQAGYWQPNPHYNPTRAYGAIPYPFVARRAHYYPGAQPAFIQWVPAQQWQLARAQQAAQMAQQQQQAQNYNPYRKKVKPPSAEYLASSLSDNPLGLENMDPTKSLYNALPPEAIAGLNDGADHTHTPWIWKPKDLENPPRQEEVPESSSESSSEEDSDDDDDDNPPRQIHLSPSPVSTLHPQAPYNQPFPPTSMQNLSVNATPSRQPLARHASMPHSSYSSASISSTTSSSSTASSGSITGQNLSDEPGSLLSPLIISNTPKPSTSTRQLTAASSGTLGRHSSVPVVLSTIPESNVRTSSYPTPSSNNTASASAYAAALGMTHRRHSQDESRSSSTSRPSSRQPSPAHTPPPQAFPQQRNTYPTVTVTSSNTNTPTPNARHHATYPQPSNAPAYQPSSTPVKMPPNTSGPYSYGFPPTNANPNPSSTSTPNRMGYPSAYQSGLGSQTTQVFYHTPPNSAPPYYPANGTPTSSARKSRTRDREREKRGSVDVPDDQPARSSFDRDKDSRGSRDWDAHQHRMGAPSFGSNANAVSPGSSYPAYMNGPPASHPPPPHPTNSSSSSNPLNAYPTPPSGGSGAGDAAPSGYSPTKEGAPYQYQYQYAQQQQQRSNSGSNTPNASLHPGAQSTNAGPGTSGKRQARKGYWNKRGDHLTPAGYVVYAPPKLAYPADLMQYPLDPGSVPPEKMEALAASASAGSPSKSSDANDERLGYMNEHGHFAPWAKRPELPESLPRHGKEAEMPYERFVEFVVV
ncbi:hypothetical protein H1R20_g578, partial [Candolleomyces eurysporus]